MLFDAILVGSQLFHEVEPLGGFYDNYLAGKRWQLWKQEGTIDLVEIERLILFLNQWRTHYENSRATQQSLLEAIQSVFPLLQALEAESLMGVDFKRLLMPGTTVSQAIEQIFERIASCGRRYESTGTAKIMHTINPGLFVMWDSSICGGYAVNGHGYDHGHRFLPRIQKLARNAIREYTQTQGGSQEQAIVALCKCGHTLAKVLDEYNYTKFTLKRDEVWNLELG
jgi:hypothetical protein